MSETPTDAVGKYLAFDPGTTTGMALFDEKGDIIRYGQYSLDELGEFLDKFTDPISTIICEEFVVFAHKARAFAGKRMEVSQAVGIIRDFARRKKVELVWQPPLIKTPAERLTGLKVKGPHSGTHWQDAFLHGAFYLITVKKIRKTALQLEHEREKGLA